MGEANPGAAWPGLATPGSPVPACTFQDGQVVPKNSCLANFTQIGEWEVYWGSVGDGGCTRITDDTTGPFSGVLQINPATSTSSGQTFSALTIGPSNGSGAFTFQVDMRTQAQLRTGSAPNNWEVGWVFWDFSFPGGSTDCYYYIIKESGTEFGRLNSGAQTFLATTSNNYNPALWHTVKVSVSGSTHTISVDGTVDISFTDSGGSALSSGVVGLYCEDSQVNFKNWSLVV